MHQFFDLALRKTTNIITPVKRDQVIPFTIEVFNQGNIIARNVEVSDYIPNGFALANGDTGPNGIGWGGPGVGGTTATTQITGPINPGESQIIMINLVVTGLGNKTEDYINVAEITSARDGDGNLQTNNDKDSTPDSDPGNDAGGLVDSPTDNAIDGNGTGTVGGTDPTTDEDDADPENIIVYDLALRKTLAATDPVKLGQTLQFRIEIFNQGNQTVQNIEN